MNGLEGSMKKLNKELELSIKALGAAMFMATVCLYLAIGAVLYFIGYDNFYFHVSFALLVQGLIVSMVASATWMVCFESAKPQSFGARYAIAFIILAILFGVSIMLPIINSTTGYLFWLIGGFVSTFAFGTAIAVLSEKHLKKTGKRSVLLWEL